MGVPRGFGNFWNQFQRGLLHLYSLTLTLCMIHHIRVPSWRGTKFNRHVTCSFSIRIKVLIIFPRPLLISHSANLMLCSVSSGMTRHSGEGKGFGENGFWFKCVSYSLLGFKAKISLYGVKKKKVWCSVNDPFNSVLLTHQTSGTNKQYIRHQISSPWIFMVDSWQIAEKRSAQGRSQLN